MVLTLCKLNTSIHLFGKLNKTTIVMFGSLLFYVNNYNYTIHMYRSYTTKQRTFRCSICASHQLYACSDDPFHQPYSKNKTYQKQQVYDENNIYNRKHSTLNIT